MSQAINITVAHTLTQEAAFQRVLTWLQSQQGKTAGVTELQTTIDHVGHKITLALEIHGYRVDAVFIVAATYVQLATNQSEDRIEAVAMWWEGMQLQKQLAEVLK